MNNLELYDKLRTPPKEALKEIAAGRLKGKTDINPMWRIKALTETFGPCGIGWKYVIKEKRIEPTDAGETAAFVDIDLYYRWDGEWSEPIPGTGGNMFVAKEKNGPYVDDECFKKALTDAISVAAKALGVGGDVYWQKDPTKYTARPEQEQNPAARQQKAAAAPAAKPQQPAKLQERPKVSHICAYCGKEIKPAKRQNGEVLSVEDIVAFGLETYGAKLCSTCLSNPSARAASR